MEFGKVKSYLSKHIDDNGTSVYSHVATIARQIVEEKPENAYELFENLSLEIKQRKLNIDKNNDIPKIFVNEEERQTLQRNIDSILRSYVINENNENNENKEIDITKCANIFKYQQLLLWSGISINSEEIYQLQCAFIRLIYKFTNIENSRFWGKIEGIINDYYIIEAKLSGCCGKGINQFVYFVTINIEDGEWIQLNDVTPQQITKCRQIYRLFSGNLNHKIWGRIQFEWTEAELLRAQIARISSATIISPNNYYIQIENEDNEQDEENHNPFLTELNQEFIANENDGISQQLWVHQRPYLRSDGILMQTESDENNEEQIPILQSIINDKCLQFSDSDNEQNESSNCWYIRQLNKNMPYKIIVINNKLWNGAKTIFLSQTKTFINVYIGNAIKYRPNYYTPTHPSLMQSQVNQNEEKSIFYDAQTEQFPPLPKANANDENNENNQ